MAKAFIPLIMIPITIILDIVLVCVGYYIDSSIYDPKPDVGSFMVPAFTIIFGIIAAILSVISLIVMIILIIVRIRRAKNR